MPPLSGLRVVDLTRVLAGPFCTMLLGDMGADVIKVEEPGQGDDARGWPPFVGEWSAYFAGVNRSKRGLALNLKDPRGQDVMRRLLSSADILIENFKPGSLDKLGFGYASTRALNSRLIHCTISGYGQTGPRRHLTGYDPIVQAESGFMDITGTPDGPPVRSGVAITDYLAGLYALSGILLALRHRDQTGSGEHVDIALYDAILSTLSMPAGIAQLSETAPGRMGNDHSSIAPYEALRAKDGLVMVAAANPRLWARLCTAIERPSLIDDARFATNNDRVRNRAALKRELEDALSAFTVDALVDTLERASVPCGKIRTITEALADPQVDARQMLLDFRDPEMPGLRVLGNPIKLSDDGARYSRRAPKLGEHTREILRELGYSEDEIVSLAPETST